MRIETAITSWGGGEVPEGPIAVLLHGYGSHEGDLAAFGPELPAGVHWASLRAPVMLQQGMYAWFPLDATLGGDPENARAAAEAAHHWIERTLPSSAAVLPVGFSQGGAMAAELLRIAPDRFAGAVLLGSFVLPGSADEDAAVALRRPPVFAGRGTDDRVIDDARVASCDAWLAATTAAETRTYPFLGHGVSRDELDDVVAFVQRILVVGS